nr:MAG TPA: hypothetical protein [Microviridae sp.]
MVFYRWCHLAQYLSSKVLGFIILIIILIILIAHTRAREKLHAHACARIII